MKHLRNALGVGAIAFSAAAACDSQPLNDLKFIAAAKQICPPERLCMRNDQETLSLTEAAARDFHNALQSMMDACSGKEIDVITSESEKVREAAKRLIMTSRGEQDNATPDRTYTKAEATLGWFNDTNPACAGIKPALNTF